MSTPFLIIFFVGLGVSAVSLFASFLHLHHGGVHFHFHHGAGSSLLKNVGDFFGSLFNLAAITMFLAWFGGVGLLLEQMTHLANALIVILAGGAGMTGAASIVRLVQAMSRQEHPLQPLQLAGTVGRLTIP